MNRIDGDVGGQASRSNVTGVNLAQYFDRMAATYYDW